MKKYALYILILIIILIGLFSPIRKVNAVTCTFNSVTGLYDTPAGCTSDPSMGITATPTILNTCTGVDPTGAYTPAGCTGGTAAITGGTAAPTTTSAFQDAVDKQECFSFSGGLSPGGCLVQFSYYLLYVIPAFLLTVVANFFNIIISITLNSALLKSTFVSTAWTVVRDLSNIFFILILLYIAIKVILGLGGSEVKKMIAKVIIIALLINFSMFFTQVVIDTSNILALIFYNKLSLVDKDGKTAPYTSITGEKDIAGGLVSAFNPTASLGEPFFTAAKAPIPPATEPLKEVPLGMMVGIILITGLILLFATYALFVSTLSFVGRLIELFVLIIFSPFAFMSSTIPLLKKVDYIGWDKWFDRLLTVSFMAPIFMFFLYFIFMLTKANIFSDSLKSGDGIIIALLRMAIPAMVVLVMLLQATKFAKKGSGVIGEMLTKGAKMAGGMALGAAVGTVAVAGRATVGRAGAAMANSEWARKREAQGKFGSGVFRDATKKMGSGSFDVRGASVGGKTLASATGMNLGTAQKGGFEERKKGQVEKRQKRVKELEVGENNPLKQALNKTEMDLQTLLSTNAQEIINLDKTIEKTRQEAVDAEKQLKAGTITKDQFKQKTDDVQTALMDKKEFMAGRGYMAKNSAGELYMKDGTGTNISDLEKLQKTQAQGIKNENVTRRTSYATAEQSGWGRTKGYILSGGAYTKAASKEAAHKIRTEVKLDSGTKT